MNVRAVTASDVESVIALVTAVLAEFGLTFGLGSETDAALLGLPASYRGRGGEFWVAEDVGAGIVGTCGVFPIDRERFELRKMYLLPVTRGRGVGRSLLSTAVAFAREQGANHLVLDTTEQMQAAIQFYESHGFVRDDSQKRGARCTRGYRLALAKSV